MKFDLFQRATIGCVSIVCAGVMAPLTSAETLPVAGIYAAREDAPAAANIIAVENFGGDKGASLSFALSDALDSAILFGEPYFQLLPANGADVDSVLRGSANSEVIEIELDDRKVTRCVKTDKDGDCIKEKVTFYECVRLEVSLNMQVRLQATRGPELYRARETLSASEESCADDSATPSANAMLDGLANDFARQVRYDLAPVYRSEQIRILESRKGLSGDDRKLFKAAIRLTKTDLGGACEGFAALENSNSQHASVLFNIGLCAEGQDDLQRAETYYRRALDIEPDKDYPTQGIQRIRNRDRAEAQMDVHYGREEHADGPKTEPSS